MIRCLVAMDEKQGIADDHGIPWAGKVPGDIKYYHDKMRGYLVLMGYGVYREMTHPYDAKKNYVATTKKGEQLRPGFEPVYDAVEFLKKIKEDIWDIGGAILFASTIDLADEVYATQLQGDFNCTKFFPEFKNEFEMVRESEPITENGVTYTFQVWRRKK